MFALTRTPKRRPGRHCQQSMADELLADPRAADAMPLLVVTARSNPRAERSLSTRAARRPIDRADVGTWVAQCRPSSVEADSHLEAATDTTVGTRILLPSATASGHELGHRRGTGPSIVHAAGRVTHGALSVDRGIARRRWLDQSTTAAATAQNEQHGAHGRHIAILCDGGRHVARSACPGPTAHAENIRSVGARTMCIGDERAVGHLLDRLSPLPSSDALPWGWRTSPTRT